MLFETNATDSLVDYESAQALCEGIEVIPGTHRSIVKPKSEADDSHIEVLEALLSLSSRSTNPCIGPATVAASQISTNSADARVVSGDSELDSNDWTSVELSYGLEVSADRRQVNLRVQWFAQERNSDRSPGNSRIASEKTIPLFKLSEKCRESKILQVDGVVQHARAEHFYRGRLRNFLSLPNTGSMSGIRVQVDAKGRSDHQVQALQAVLPGFSVLVGPGGNQ